MVLRRFPDDCAFETYLRDLSAPYVAVDEARRSPCSAPSLDPQQRPTISTEGTPLKSFDFVVYTQSEAGDNLLVDVKGRSCRHSRFECWVTEDDVSSLTRWQELFGPSFRAAFVFLHWWDDIPADGLFREVFEHRGRWYAPSLVMLDDYAAAMRPRSSRWRTVSLRKADFDRLSQPLSRLLRA
ncbi:MAG: HYExAFE family protein [Phycisphaeraceae bacterium]